MALFEEKLVYYWISHFKELRRHLVVLFFSKKRFSLVEIPIKNLIYDRWRLLTKIMFLTGSHIFTLQNIS